MAVSKTQRMKKALSEKITPLLQQSGFTGEYPDYLRQLDKRVDAISFVLNRAGDISIEIAQVLPDGSVPGQPGSMSKIKASWTHYSLKHRLGSVPWGHDGFIASGWLKTERMSPDVFPRLTEQIIDMIKKEAYPWFSVEPVFQYLDIVQNAIPTLLKMGFEGAFPDFQRRLQNRIDMLGFFIDKSGYFSIEIAQVRPDGSEGFGKPPYPFSKPEHMKYYNVSHRLRKRLKGFLILSFPKKISPAERALAMIQKEAEPWFKSCPVLKK